MSAPPEPLLLAPRAEFVAAVRQAVATRTPFAAAKIGTSEKHWMYYPAVQAAEPDVRRRVAFELALRHHARSSGIFPLTTASCLTFNEAYIRFTRELDYLGLVRDLRVIEDGVIAHHRLTNRFMDFRDQEPDRSGPARPDNCYLPAFAGQRLLLICPFAGLLRERATRTTFERVWARTGQRWFDPDAVDALELPYGFEPSTEARYGTILNLAEHVAAEMATRQFDVALVAAAALNIPLVVAAKRLGKVAIGLGGHLQVLFGVAGRRWHQDPEWPARYFNAWWIDMPLERRPAGYLACDNGSYW